MLVGCTFANFFFFLSAANFERSNLYLKLFKLVFGSVSLFANENEQMLKVYTELRHIIGSSDIIAKRIYSLSCKYWDSRRVMWAFFCILY